MAYKRRRSYRKTRPRKRRRTAYRRKRYTKRYSKFYNMRQRNYPTRSTFRGTRDVVFPDAPSRVASLPPQDYNSWNPYLTAALSAGALGYGAYNAYNQIKPAYDDVLRDYWRLSLPKNDDVTFDHALKTTHSERMNDRSKVLMQDFKNRHGTSKIAQRIKDNPSRAQSREAAAALEQQRVAAAERIAAMDRLAMNDPLSYENMQYPYKPSKKTEL